MIIKALIKNKIVAPIKHFDMKNKITIVISILLLVLVVVIILFRQRFSIVSSNKNLPQTLDPRPTVTHPPHDPNIDKLPIFFDLLSKESGGEKLNFPVKFRLEDGFGNDGWFTLRSFPYHDVTLDIPFETATMVRYLDPSSDVITAEDPDSYKLSVHVTLQRSLNNFQNPSTFIQEQLKEESKMGELDGSKKLSTDTGMVNGTPYYLIKRSTSIGLIYFVTIFSPRTIINIAVSGSEATSEIVNAIISSIVSEKYP